jgi:hypothetical protein
MSENGFKDMKTYDNIMSENTLKEKHLIKI